MSQSNIAPMSDAQLRAEYSRRERAARSAAERDRTPSVASLLAALDELPETRLASDGASVVTCSELTADVLGDLFANRTCALRIPAFVRRETREGLLQWLGACEPKQFGGTDTAYAAGVPLTALSWSLEDALLYFREALPAMRRLRAACSTGLAPMDQLRLELDEVWPAGANVSSENPYGRKMFVGLTRVMRPEKLLDGITRIEGCVHTDSKVFLDEARGAFSANVYLDVPPEGGELNVFPLAMRQPDAGDDLLRAVAVLLEHAFDPDPELRDRVQRMLHRLLPTPITIRPDAGDLIILNTGRPHAVRGFAVGKRVTMQAFIEFRRGRPLQLFS